MTAALEGVDIVHQGQMPEIFVPGAREAEGIWAMEDRFWAANGSGTEVSGRWRHGFGHYHDCYRKAHGRWLIAGTRLSRIRAERG